MLALLQFINGFEDLTYLVRFGLAFIVLDVDARVTRPRHFKDSMTAASLARLTKIRFAYIEQRQEPDAGGLTAHLFEGFIYHLRMVPLLAPFVKSWALLPPSFCTQPGNAIVASVTLRPFPASLRIDGNSFQ
ncbi:hypothetical protein [Paraburkholderia sartisoli]|uniref:hypothetical protein n=1 Tax=Paraburkholderia sartisoli TaxID=83784 RepID=UPI0015A0E3FC|nr:hypothetical protein [Paraburkholderia sartisoli]